MTKDTIEQFVFVFVVVCQQTKLETYFVEIGQLSDLLPETEHYVLVFLEAGVTKLALALDNGRSEGETREIVLVQVAVAVYVYREIKYQCKTLFKATLFLEVVIATILCNENVISR